MTIQPPLHTQPHFLWMQNRLFITPGHFSLCIVVNNPFFIGYDFSCRKRVIFVASEQRIAYGNVVHYILSHPNLIAIYGLFSTALHVEYLSNIPSHVTRIIFNKCFDLIIIKIWWDKVSYFYCCAMILTITFSHFLYLFFILEKMFSAVIILSMETQE